MAIDLTILGCRAGIPGDEPSSGYLLTTPATTVLLDCGPGVFARLQTLGLSGRLDGVVLSHMHQDHCTDAFVLARSLANTRSRGDSGGPGSPGPGTDDGAGPSPVPPLLLPEGGAELLAAMNRLFPVAVLPAYQRCFEIGLRTTTLADGGTARIGDVDLEAVRLRHASPDNGIRATSGGLTVAYTGDTGPCEEVVRLARGADLLLCEATFDRDGVHPEHGHLSAQEAGAIAEEAGVGLLVLTHFLDGSPAWRHRQAQLAGEQFSGPVLTATAGMTVPIGTGRRPAVIEQIA